MKHKSERYIQEQVQDQERLHFPLAMAWYIRNLYQEEGSEMRYQLLNVYRALLINNYTWQCNMEVCYTQRLFAKTIALTAPTNCSTDGDGMHIRSAPICIRIAFSSGRKRRMLPSCFLYAFRPSNNPWLQTSKRWKDTLWLKWLNTTHNK